MTELSQEVQKELVKILNQMKEEGWTEIGNPQA